MVGIIGSQSVSPASFVRPQGTADSGSARNKGPGNPGLAVDVYSADREVWRNRATAADAQTGCRCGNCPACAAQAYASQAGQGQGVAQSSVSDESVAASEQEGPEQKQDAASPADPKGVDGEALTPQEQNRVVELKKVDQAVRAHEQAHMAAAGGLVRKGVSLSYEKGPDGRRYAVGGEVSIDTSKEADPAATISKMRTVRAAALAPAEPSAQDRKVAAAAAVTMTNAMGELRVARTADEDGENALGRAAKAMAEPRAEDPSSAPGGSAGPEEALTSAASPPRRNWMTQHYTANLGAQGKRAEGISLMG